MGVKKRTDSGVSPDYDAHSTLSRTRKPSAAVRPSAAKKAFGVSPDYDTTQHAHAHNKPSSVEKGNSSCCYTTRTRYEARTKATSSFL